MSFVEHFLLIKIQTWRIIILDAISIFWTDECHAAGGKPEVTEAVNRSHQTTYSPLNSTPCLRA